MKPAVGLLRQLFRYEPETGFLIRLVTTSNRCSAGHRAGTIKSTGKQKKTYRQVRIDRVLWHEHEVIWAMMTGEWAPEDQQIDHENDDGTDNRWTNLRLATPRQNTVRQRGHIGVRWHQRDQLWVVRIGRKYVGSSKCWGRARKMYTEAHAIDYGKWSPHTGIMRTIDMFPAKEAAR